MAKKPTQPKNKLERADGFHEFYSQVQVFGISDAEAVITFLRAQPVIDPVKFRQSSDQQVWVEEAIAYIPLRQAKEMAAKLLHLIEQQENRTQSAGDEGNV